MNVYIDNTLFKKGLRLAAGVLLFLSPPALADDWLQHPEQFIAEAFDGTSPEPALIWLTGARGDAVEAILGHRPASLRVRYWQRDARTVWILEEIGREKLITAGFVIEAGAMKQAKVLAFRESRGWEIRHEFFTDQFRGMQLDAARELSKPIDNISGATLSVNAMQRMARVALFLDHEVRDVAP